MVNVDFEGIKKRIKPEAELLIDLISREYEDVPTEEIPIGATNDHGPMVRDYQKVANPRRVITSKYIQEKKEDGHFEDVADWLYETGNGFELALSDEDGNPIEDPSKETATGWYQHFLLSFVGDIMAYSGGFRLAEDAYDDAFEKAFVQRHYKDQLNTTISFLYHFDGPNFPVDLSPDAILSPDETSIENIEISPLTSEEVSAVYKFESFLFETGGRVGVDAFSNVSHKVEVKSRGNVGGPIQTVIDHVVSALRLFGPDVPKLGRGRKFRTEYNWLTYREGIPRVSGSSGAKESPNAFGDDYVLLDDQIEDFKSFWNDYSSSLGGEDTSLSTALRKFNQSYEKANAEDRLIDCAIAFESTIIKELRQTESYRYRLPIRAALLLAGSEKEQREYVYRFFREIYDARSRVVHTGDSIDSVSVQNESYPPRKFVHQTREFLRQTLVRYLELLDEYPSIDEVNRAMDRAMREAPSPFI